MLSNHDDEICIALFNFASKFHNFFLKITFSPSLFFLSLLVPISAIQFLCIPMASEKTRENF